MAAGRIFLAGSLSALDSAADHSLDPAFGARDRFYERQHPFEVLLERLDDREGALDVPVQLGDLFGQPVDRLADLAGALYRRRQRIADAALCCEGAAEDLETSGEIVGIGRTVGHTPSVERPGAGLSGPGAQAGDAAAEQSCDDVRKSLMLTLTARTRIVLGRFTALALLFMLVVPASSQAFSKAIWGQPYRNGVNQFPLYRQLGVSIDQLTLPWADVAPTRPQNPTDPSDPAYLWPSEIQQAVTQARRFHMRVLLQITGAPAWANGGHGSDWAPRHPADFAAFATAASRHYHSVHLWMIWGEPTRSGNFEPLVAAHAIGNLDRAQRAAPHAYARILDAAYGALKKVSSHSLVIGGCTYTTGLIDPQQWIENLRLPNGRPPRMDMYAHNPFSYQAPSFSVAPSPFGEVQFSDLHELAGWIDRYLRPRMPIFLSEWTIPTGPDDEFNFYVDQPTAAQWITDALHLARHYPRIYALGWVNVYDHLPVSSGGLLTQDGARKLGFAAFAAG